MNYEEEKSKISGSVIIQAVAIIVGFILAAIIVSGFEFSSTIFKDPAFYISSAISFAVMMMTFQIAKNTAYSKGREEINTPYYNVVSSYSQLLKMIESAKLEEEVERACHEATKKEYLKRIDLLLRKYVTKIDHSNYETLSEVEIKQIALDAGLNKARTNGLLKTIYKCRQGNFKYIKFNHLDILIDVEYDSGKYHPQEMQMRMTRYNFSEIWKKVIWFLISTALVNSLVFKKGSLEEFLVSLASQAFLILSSTVTGIFSGNKQLMYRKQIINNRVIFLSANVFKEVQK